MYFDNRVHRKIKFSDEERISDCKSIGFVYNNDFRGMAPRSHFPYYIEVKSTQSFEVLYWIIMRGNKNGRTEAGLL